MYPADTPTPHILTPNLPARPSISAFFTKTPQKRAATGPGTTSARSSPDIVDITDDVDAVAGRPTKRARTAGGDVGEDSEAPRSRVASAGKTSTFFQSASSTSQSQAQKQAQTAARCRAILDAAAPPARAVLSKYRAAARLDGAGAVGHSGRAFEAYGLGQGDTNVPDGGEATPSQRARDPAAQARHEAWQRRTGSMTGLVPRRRSLPLEEAAARAVAGSGGDDNGEEGDEDEAAAVLSDDEGQEEAGPRIGRAAPAAATVASKGKPRGKGKKAEPVGPSGLPFTPLEKQFMEIKAANEDVLLFTEGECCAQAPVG